MKTVFAKRINHASGFTLVECMMAALILMILITGLMGFRYYTVFNAELAENQLLAMRTACLLSEAWKGQNGDLEFDPLSQDFDDNFEVSRLSGAGRTRYLGLSSLGSYQVRLDNKEFEAELFYGKMWGLSRLRSIHVIVRWQDHHGLEHEYHLPTLTGNAAS